MKLAHIRECSSRWILTALVIAFALLATGQGAEILAADQYTEPMKMNASPRYKLTVGTGYTVCERYLKMLNAFPRDTPQPICEQKIHPNYSDFEFPKWENLEISSHSNLIVELERWLYSKHDFPWSAQYQPGNKQLPDLETWLSVVRARIRSGEAKPVLRRTEIVLAAGKSEKLLSYKRDSQQCRAQLSKIGWPTMSWNYLFLYGKNGNVDERKLDSLGGTVGGNLQVIVHNKKTYFVFTEPQLSPSHPTIFHLEVAIPAFANLRGVDYIFQERCAISATAVEENVN